MRELHGITIQRIKLQPAFRTSSALKTKQFVSAATASYVVLFTCVNVMTTLLQQSVR